MKKTTILCFVTILLCLSLTGCKGSAYKEAVSLEEAKDYSAALEIYKEISDYKDSTDRIAICEEMLSAIDGYEVAKANIEDKNAAIDAEISDAERVIADGKMALDNMLISALETAISETKAVKVSIPEMPETAEEINAVSAKLNAVNYDEAVKKLKEQQNALETSIKQYSLVDAPSEAYIIQCLSKVNNVVDISAVTEDNDPNGKLNKAGGYTAQVYFSSDLINQELVYGNTIIEKGTDCGGSIEVYANVEDAEKRDDYLASFDGTIFASGSHTVIGTVIIRTSDELTASQQKEMEENIISALTDVTNY